MPRVVITAVLVEGRSWSEVARAYDVSQPWISQLLARYRVARGADGWMIALRHAGSDRNADQLMMRA